jgi:hypothetical protein
VILISLVFAFYQFSGQKVVGIVSTVIRKGRIKFGFINIVDSSKPTNEEQPRIYFNFTYLTDPSTTIRKGYEVAFECKLDESGRSFASGIGLTEEGVKIAAAREEAIALEGRGSDKKQLAGAGGAGEAAGAAPRKRAPRLRSRGSRSAVVPGREQRLVSLAVVLEGKPEEVKSVQADLNQSVGVLKTEAVLLFSAAQTLKVFYQGEYLTTKQFEQLKENDLIELREVEAIARPKAEHA